ncbi:hypothetical protein EGW08_005634 [Elysia chlorotica]|uniref:Uncharacterized protein n=1 Tax=Elysia chlorotica TaxID=188477 RepID=A0A3S0ZV53_ELYCH|nr:hypothetical protein EGW08_005634 [Elysia chlorotica]
MRRAVDEVTSTPTAHAHRLFLPAVVVSMVIMTVILPVVSPAHGGSPESGNDARTRQVTVELRVLYICDNTSAEFCQQPDRSRDAGAEADDCGADPPRVPVLPRGCKDLTPAPDNGNQTTRSGCNTVWASHNTPPDQGRDEPSNDTQEDVSAPPYLCWRLSDGGVVLERNLNLDTPGVLRAHVTYRTIEGTMVDKMRTMDLFQDFTDTDVIVAVGDSVTVQLSALAGEWRKLPVLGYITSYPELRKCVAQQLLYRHPVHTSVPVLTITVVSSALLGMRETAEVSLDVVIEGAVI